MVAPIARPPDKTKAPGGGEASGAFKISNAQIIYLERAHRKCVDCGVTFRALRSSHMLCRRCYAWRAIGYYSLMAAAALRGTR